MLHLARRGSGDVNFRECTDEWDGVESVTDPHHRETVRECRHQVWGVITLELDALVEIIDGFSKPQANDQKRGDSCRGSFFMSAKDVKKDISTAYRS